MLLFLFFGLFLSVPMIEIGLFIQVGSEIGVAATLSLIVLTALLGSVLVRAQGKSTLKQAKSNLNQGILPVESVIDGIGLVISGLMLITPGFFTDAIGFILLTPFLRHAILLHLFNLLKKKSNIKAQGTYNHDDTILEGEYHHNLHENLKKDADS